METHRYVLFVRAGSHTSIRAQDSLAQMLAEAGVEDAVVEVVDVGEHPDRAEAEGILATPTLVREMPPPRRRVVGDLSDLGIVRAALGLPQMYPMARGASD